MNTTPIPTTSGETLKIGGIPVLQNSMRVMSNFPDIFGKRQSLCFGLEPGGEPLIWVQTMHGDLLACDYTDDPFSFAVFLAKMVGDGETGHRFYEDVKAGAGQLTSAITQLRDDLGNKEAFSQWTQMTELALEQAKRKNYWAFLQAFSEAAGFEDDDILEVHHSWRDFSHRLEAYQCRLIEDGGAREGVRYGKEFSQNW